MGRLKTFVGLLQYDLIVGMNETSKGAYFLKFQFSKVFSILMKRYLNYPTKLSNFPICIICSKSVHPCTHYIGL